MLIVLIKILCTLEYTQFVCSVLNLCTLQNDYFDKHLEASIDSSGSPFNMEISAVPFKVIFGIKLTIPL